MNDWRSGKMLVKEEERASSIFLFTRRHTRQVRSGPSVAHAEKDASTKMEPRSCRCSAGLMTTRAC